MMLLSKRLAQEGFEVLYYVKDRSDWPKDVPVLENVDANLAKLPLPCIQRLSLAILFVSETWHVSFCSIRERTAE